MSLKPVPATSGNIHQAAEHLRQGDLVAFPTETVYGLGADARNGKAVAQIFAAKGRPTFNPLIIHVADITAAREWAKVTPLADQLVTAFWPGGLTMVLEQRPGAGLSDLVSAGLPTIAIRVPSHPVATQLLRTVQGPIAAPSANRSGHVSATTADHVAADLAAEASLAMILDDGPCPLGLESTIIDVTGNTPRLLRPGAITVEEIEAAAGQRIAPGSAIGRSSGSAARSSPGQLESHYAPVKPLLMNITEPSSDQALLAFGEPPAGFNGDIYNLSPSSDLVEAAAELFAALRKLDGSAASGIAAMPVPDHGLGRAINDRLRRAAAPRQPPGHHT